MPGTKNSPKYCFHKIDNPDLIFLREYHNLWDVKMESIIHEKNYLHHISAAGFIPDRIC